MVNASTPYLSIVAMLVESYALDSAWSFAAALSYQLDSPGVVLLVDNDSTVKVCKFIIFSAYFIQPSDA